MAVRICVSLGLPVIVAVSACTVDLAVPPRSANSLHPRQPVPRRFCLHAGDGPFACPCAPNQPPTVATGNVSNAAPLSSQFRLRSSMPSATRCNSLSNSIAARAWSPFL